jgi:hypothetical protein
MGMTPIEIFEYKKSWQREESGYYVVPIHSDYRWQAKQVIKNQKLKPQSWDFRKYTDVYEDTYCFEYENDAKLFEKFFTESETNG